MHNMRNMRIFGCPLRRRYLRTNSGVSETYEYAPFFAHNPEVGAKHGTNMARIIIARQLLRSLYKMLRDQVPFNRLCAA
jgi:hypothetical protein